jgi:hypothetical protein
MNEPEIFDRMNALSEEEERLYRVAGDGGGLGTTENERLRAINVELDRCYDLLHQRAARRAAGQNPDGAAVRRAEVVEHYQQ